MKLCDIFSCPTQSLDYMERYVNEGSPSGFTWINTTSKETEPRSNTSQFYLYEGSAKNGAIESYGKIPLNLDCNITLLHPDMVLNKEICNNVNIYKSKYLAVPTSSGRTVRISNNRNIYVKLHYDGLIGRVNRKITRNHALSGLETTFLLYEATDNMPSFFTFLPEIGCKILKCRYYDSLYEFGTVFRETTPFGRESKNIKIIIPLFSLLSKDFFHPEDDLLIEQIIKYSGINAYDYVMKKILKQIIDCYFILITNMGLQPEWHGQNLLLGFNKEMSKVYIIARDLDSVDRDLDIMKNLNINTNFKSYPYKCLESSQYNYYIKHSFMFDHKIGEYIIEPFVSFLEKNYGIPSYELEEDIKSYVNKYLKKLPEKFFPINGCWYKFENVIVNQDISYRPYIELKNPKYRRE